MKNNYLLECVDWEVLSKEIEKIIVQTQFQNASRSIYDMEEKDLSDALEDLDTYNFLSDKKIIIIRNVFYNQNEKKMNHLLKYLDNYSEDNLLILTVNKLDNRLNIVKKLKKNDNIEIKALEIDPFQYIKNILKNYKISNECISLLNEKCKSDITKISNECAKLMNYKVNDLEITKEDIDHLVVKKLGESNEVLFAFVQQLLLKNKKSALEKYRELLEYHVDSASIIGLIASQLRLIYQVKVLAGRNLYNDQIANELNLKSSYQVKKMREYGYDYTYQELSNLVHSIADLDFKIKSGKLDANHAIEMLVINL